MIKNKDAVIWKPIETILILGVIVIMYAMFSPLEWYLTQFTLTHGAPAGNALSFMHMFNWGFMIMAVGTLLILVIWIYKKLHDTRQERMF